MLFRRLLPLVRTVAFRRGVTGAGKVWFAIWIGSEALERGRKLVTPQPEHIDTITLRSGQGVVVRDLAIDRGTMGSAEKRSRRLARSERKQAHSGRPAR